MNVLASIDLATAAPAGALAAGAVFAYGMFWPDSSLFCPVITRGDPSQSGFALTFDDGPTPGATDRTLDVLRHENARATFFVLGDSARRHAALVRRIVDEGHIVANHTLFHSYRCCFHWRDGWIDELRRADDAIEDVIGRRPAFFRAPLGYKSVHLANAVRRTGHRVINWSRRALDGVTTTPDEILRRLLPTRAGDILALHDGVLPNVERNPEATLEALPRLLESLRGRALHPVPLDSLIGIRAYQTPSPETGTRDAPRAPASDAA